MLFHARRLVLLGGELRGSYLWGAGLDRGVFSLPLVLDLCSWVE